MNEICKVDIEKWNHFLYFLSVTQELAILAILRLNRFVWFVRGYTQPIFVQFCKANVTKSWRLSRGNCLKILSYKKKCKESTAIWARVRHSSDIISKTCFDSGDLIFDKLDIKFLTHDIFFFKVSFIKNVVSFCFRSVNSWTSGHSIYSQVNILEY